MSMIILEKYSEENFPLYAQLVYNEQAMNMNLGRVFTPDEAESFFQMMLACNSSGSTQGFYKVLLRQGEKTEYIGMGAMNWNDEYNAVEIEYMLLPEYWNHGYGRALVQHMLEIIRSSDEQSDIAAVTDPANRYSQRILEHEGFVFVEQFINHDGEAAQLYKKQRSLN